MKRLFWASLFICLILIGCAPSVKSVRFDNEIRAARPTVEVFTAFESVSWPYKEIAMIVADDEGNGYSEVSLIEGVIAEARRLGADAVVITGRETGNAGYIGAPVGGLLFVGGIQQRVVRGTAIIKK